MKDLAVLETVGKIAGLAGLAIGFATLIFRDIIAKKIFPRLPAQHAYRLLRLIVICTFALALVGITLWQAPAIVGGRGNTMIQNIGSPESKIDVK